MNRLLAYSSILLTLFALPSCEKEAPKPRPVVVIGSDGFSAEVYAKHKEEFPNIKALAENGSHAPEIRTVLPSSSAVNWASMLTGSPPELHGFTQATSVKPEVKPRILNQYGMYPGIYGLLREQRPTAISGYFYQWKGMEHLYEKGSETASLHGNPEEIKAKGIEFITQSNPDLTFIVFDEPDHVGHTKGWMGAEYIDMCKQIDKHVGDIVTAIKSSPQGEDTIILFVSDHGGIKTSHGGKTMEEMQSMFVISGKGIKKNYIMSDIHMIYDITPTITHFLNISPSSAWRGRVMTEIFDEEKK